MCMTDQLLRVDAEVQHAAALRWNLVAAVLLSSVVLGYGMSHSSITTAFTNPVFHVRAQDESTASVANLVFENGSQPLGPTCTRGEVPSQPTRRGLIRATSGPGQGWSAAPGTNA
jgi:hypothetical protein